jgi:hypothetical protein
MVEIVVVGEVCYGGDCGGRSLLWWRLLEVEDEV